MTRLEFLAALREAITVLGPVLMTGPGYWPRGAYLRFVVNRRPSERDDVPPVVDPIGLVWYHAHRQIKTPLDAPTIAAVLGLDPVEAGLILLVSDGKACPDEALVAQLHGAARQCQARFL